VLFGVRIIYGIYTMTYEIQATIASGLRHLPFLTAYEKAMAALAQLDERLKRADGAMREGMAARADYHEAQSLVGLGGGFLHFNDLVLFDVDSNVLIPTEEVLRGKRLLVRRRALRRMPTSELLGSENLSKLTGLSMDNLLGEEPEDEFNDMPLSTELSELDAVLGRPRLAALPLGNALLELRPYPSLLGGLALIDFWRSGENSPMTEIGPFLIACYLRARNAVSHHPALARGLWHQSPKWEGRLDPEIRLTILANGVISAAKKAMVEMDQLILAKEIMSLKLTAKGLVDRENSLAKLIDLFIATPLVTVELAVRRLRITPQAIEYLMKKLGPALPREKTGRQRYRAWGI
jgi:HTH DNA binding domain/Protein of unknown function (DUF1612)